MKMHLSLDVQDVGKSVAFYRKVFGVNPQKQTQRYAKFDLQEPALNFSMQRGSELNKSKVNHLGVEVETAQQLERWRNHLEEERIVTRPEENVECCHARQDKLWFRDPDGNEWEIFLVHEQLPIQEEVKQAAGCCGV